MLISTMWKVMTSNEVFSSVNSRINVLSMLNLMFDSTVFVFNLTLLLIRSKALNCSMFSIDRSAASQFINVLLNSRSSYRESVVEIKLNDSLMRVVMMMQFFEIKRCLNVWFVNKLMTNSMFCNSSTEIKNSSIDSNSIKNALMFVDEIAEMIAKVLAKVMLIENSLKYWIISSWSSFSSFSVFLYSQIYWWRRLLFLNCEKRFAKRFFESSRFFSEWLIDQQLNLSHTKHFLRRRFWNLSFDLSRNSSR